MGKRVSVHPRAEQVTQLQIRISPRLKAIIERAASAASMSVSEWVRLVVEQAADRPEQTEGRELRVEFSKGQGFAHGEEIVTWATPEESERILRMLRRRKRPPTKAPKRSRSIGK